MRMGYNEAKAAGSVAAGVAVAGLKAAGFHGLAGTIGSTATSAGYTALVGLGTTMAPVIVGGAAVVGAAYGIKKLFDWLNN